MMSFLYFNPIFWNWNNQFLSTLLPFFPLYSLDTFVALRMAHFPQICVPSSIPIFRTFPAFYLLVLSPKTRKRNGMAATLAALLAKTYSPVLFCFSNFIN